MKNNLIAIIVITFITVISWVIVLSTSRTDDNQINVLRSQIEANLEVKTYKNTIELYKEAIRLEPDNIEWRTGLANVYWEMNQLGNYKKMCEGMLSDFPDNSEGYIRLMRYYDDEGEVASVIGLYNKAPDDIRSIEEFLNIYKKREWDYQYLSKGYTHIGPCTSGVYTMENNGLYGFCSSKIDYTVEPQFDIARPFISNYAAVFNKGEWYFVDIEGDRVVASKDKIEDLYSFSGDYAVAKLDGKYGYIDMSFSRYSFDYDDATSFYNDVAAVKKDGKWGLINTDFEVILPFDYDDVIRDDANICSRNGIVLLKKDSRYLLFNTNGQQTSDVAFEDARLFYSDYAAVKKDGKWGFVDKSGNTVIDFTYDDASSCSLGVAAVKIGEKWGFVDLSGNIALEPDFDYAFINSDNGVAVVKIDEIYRFIRFVKFNIK